MDDLFSIGLGAASLLAGEPASTVQVLGYAGILFVFLEGVLLLLAIFLYLVVCLSLERWLFLRQARALSRFAFPTQAALAVLLVHIFTSLAAQDGDPCHPAPYLLALPSSLLLVLGWLFPSIMGLVFAAMFLWSTRHIQLAGDS